MLPLVTPDALPSNCHSSSLSDSVSSTDSINQTCLRHANGQLRLDSDDVKGAWPSGGEATSQLSINAMGGRVYSADVVAMTTNASVRRQLLVEKLGSDRCEKAHTRLVKSQSECGHMTASLSSIGLRFRETSV